MRKIRSNLLWVLIYNTIMVTVAAIGLLNPVLYRIYQNLMIVRVGFDNLFWLLCG